MKRLILLLVLLISASFTQADILKQHQVFQAQLDNGLGVVVKVDDRAPVFISQLWYRVGASDESRPHTGISHMLEHMMFKGTNDYKAGEFSKIIAKHGGDENAFTSKDYTAYYQKMHKSKLALAIKMEADRMRNLTFSNPELEKERQVVIEERRLRVEDNPNAKVYEQLRLNAFAPEGAYHSPVIGFQTDIETYRLGDLRDWYERYYAPDNATLVVVGDVDPTEVMTHVKRYFGHYVASDLALQNRASVARVSPPSQLKLKAKLPFYTLGFHVPSLTTADNPEEAYQLEMLAYVLDNGLSKGLIRNQQLASSIGVGYRLYDKYNTLFTISFVPAKGVETQQLLLAIQSQIKELIDQPQLVAPELGRTKAQLEAAFVFEQDLIHTQAYYLGMLESIGLGVESLFEYVPSMNQVQARDLSNVASKYLDFTKANQVELMPQGVK